MQGFNPEVNDSLEINIINPNATLRVKLEDNNDIKEKQNPNGIFGETNVIKPPTLDINPVPKNNLIPNQFSDLNKVNMIQPPNYNDNRIKDNLNEQIKVKKKKEITETKIEATKIFGPLNPYKSRGSGNAILLTKTYNINIIFYDENTTNSDDFNYYCSYFKSNLEGAFYGINDFNLFRYVSHKIHQNTKNFILISSGFCAEKIFNYCFQKGIYQIDKYYIYCLNKPKYYHFMQKYPNLKGILSTFDDLKKVITDNQPAINKHIRSSNLIFLSDYNSTFIKLHYEIVRKYSLYKLFKSKDYDKTKFLDLIQNKFPYYENIARELIYNDDEAMVKFFKDITKEPEEELRKVFNHNHEIADYISNYTIESFYFRNINRFLRTSDFRSYRILSNHISKFIYHLYEYRKTHYQLSNSVLYRSMYITQDEFNLYLNSIGKVICYPSFTSTSLKRKSFIPYNKISELFVELIIQQNNSPSIISIRDLSNHPNEEEYLCLPFTFFKITNVDMGNNIIYLTALRSEKPIEDMFLEFMENETDNLDPEGLEMIKLNNDGISFVLNPNLRAEVYKEFDKKYKVNF